MRITQPDAPARFQVLADPTGRRRRRLALAGRIGTAVLGLWLVALTLGGLGLQPLAGLPVVGSVGTGGSAPPALPARVRIAVARRTTVAPRASSPAAGTPSSLGGRPATGSVPTRIPGAVRTAPRRPASRTLTPPRSATSPSITAPGKTRSAPVKTRTAPVKTRTAPRKTRTAPVKTQTTGPPGVTPGTTPGSKSNGKGVGAPGPAPQP